MEKTTYTLEAINKMPNLPDIPVEAIAVKYFFAWTYKEKPTHVVRKFNDQDPEWVKREWGSILDTNKAGYAYGVQFVSPRSFKDIITKKNNAIYIINGRVVDIKKLPGFDYVSNMHLTEGKGHTLIIQTENDRSVAFDEKNMIVVENTIPWDQKGTEVIKEETTSKVKDTLIK